jgi:hypothetical protein
MEFLRDQAENLGEREFHMSDFTIQISHLKSHLQTAYQHTHHFYTTTLINHNKGWTQWEIRTACTFSSNDPDILIE